MLGIIELHALPVFQLIERSEIVLETSFFRMVGRFNRKLEYKRICLFHRLPHLWIERHALIAHELKKRVGRADAHAADVVWRVTRVNAR